MTNERITPTEWMGRKKLEFLVDGRESFVVMPEKPLDGNPWVWRTEFFGAFPSADLVLLEKGWHLAYHRVSDMYGNPESVAMMKQFHRVATETFHLSPKAVLFGFSRGGLYAVNYAARFPQDVALLYLDAPVLDIRSWPCGKEGLCREQCLEAYHLTPDQLPSFCQNPLDKVGALLEAHLPVMLVAGAVDQVVPYDENGAILYERYKAAGGCIDLVLKKL